MNLKLFCWCNTWTASQLCIYSILNMKCGQWLCEWKYDLECFIVGIKLSWILIVVNLCMLWDPSREKYSTVKHIPKFNTLFEFFSFFHSRTVHPDIKVLFIQLNALLDYSRLKLTLEFTLKCCYMFRLTKHHQGAYCRALLMYGNKLPGDLE